MKKVGMILILILIILTGFWIYALQGSNQISPSREPTVFLKQSDNRGQVTVDVTPISLEAGKEVKFEVVLDTHSVELSYDLLTVSSLSDDTGQNFKPLSWSGGSGGHHLSGELVFPAISKNAKFVELVIFNIEGVDRRFKWDFWLASRSGKS